jgi:hypothetical protein
LRDEVPCLFNTTSTWKISFIYFFFLFIIIVSELFIRSICCILQPA